MRHCHHQLASVGKTLCEPLVVWPHFLNDDFGRLMDANIDAQQLKGKYAPRRLTGPRGRQLQRRPSVDLSGRISRLLMHYLGQLCLVDLYGGHSFVCEFNPGHHRQSQKTQNSNANDQEEELDQWHQATNATDATNATNAMSGWTDLKNLSTRKSVQAQHKRRLSSPLMSQASGSLASAWCWPKIIRFVYLYCMGKAMVTLYFQYSYDFNLTLLEHSRTKANSTSNTMTTTTKAISDGHLQQYELAMAQAKSMLRLLGAPFMNLKFSIETTYIFFLLVSLGLYIQTQLYFAYVCPFDYTLVRSIMDFRQELKLCNRIIRGELNKFIESSRVFTSILVTFGEPGKRQQMRRRFSLRDLEQHEFEAHEGKDEYEGEGALQCPMMHEVSQRTQAASEHIQVSKRALMEHSLTIRQLEQMALGGSLVPANKERAWIKRLAHANCLYTLAYLCYCVLILFVLAIGLPSVVKIRVECEFMDLVTMLEMIFIVILVNTSSTFWGSVVLATSLDQVYLVYRLRRQFERCIHLNTLRAYSIMGWTRATLNTDASAHTGQHDKIVGPRSWPQTQQHGMPGSREVALAAEVEVPPACDSNDLTYYLKHFDHLRRSRSSYSLLADLRARLVKSGLGSVTATRQGTELPEVGVVEPGLRCGGQDNNNPRIPRAQSQRRPWTAHALEIESGANVVEPQHCQPPPAEAFTSATTHASNNAERLIRSNHVSQMNADLLELLMNYKIFVAQLEPIKRSYGFVTLTTCTLMILMPIIGRIHVPYVDGRIKLYVGLLSVLCTIVCDLLILIPVSYLYTRCSELYKSLSSLLAHAVWVSAVIHSEVGSNEATTTTTTTGHRQIYNEHTIFAIRKELAHPDRLVDQFVTRQLGIRLTYSNLLKIHFWIGFITQSFLFETSAAARPDLFGSFFIDPLGLFGEG